MRVSHKQKQPRNALRCFVAFAAPLVSLGIVAALAASPGFRTRSVAGTRRAILDNLEREAADILVVGTRLDCGSSLVGLLGQLRAASRAPYAVALVPKIAASLCPVLRSAGAAAILPLEIEPAILPDALRACWRGGGAAEAAAYHPRSDSTAGSVDLSVLTNTEREIFQQIGTGAPPRVIAARIGISPKTVESHRANIKAKLGIRSPSAFNEIARAWVLWDSTGIDYVI